MSEQCKHDYDPQEAGWHCEDCLLERIADLEAKLAHAEAKARALADELSDASMNEVQWLEWADEQAKESNDEKANN